MKKSLLALLFLSTIPSLLFASHTAAFADKPGYSIKVKVKGIVAKDTCYLAYYNWDKQYLKDTAIADVNGAFAFSGKDNLPNGIYLVVLPGRKYFECIVKEQNFSLETDTSDYVKYMKVKNSLENEAFYEYLRFIEAKGKVRDSLRKEYDKVKDDKTTSEPLRQKIIATDNDVKAYKTKVAAAHPGTFLSMLFKATEDPIVPENPNPKDSLYAYRYYKAHYFDNISFKEDDILRTPIFYEKVKNYMENLTYHHPDSIKVSADILVAKAKGNKELFKYIVHWLTYYYETAKWMGSDAIFVHMVKKYYTNGQASWLDSARLAKIEDRARKLEPLLIGKKAPQLYLQDTSAALNSGNTNKLKMYALYDIKAKYTVLIFWDPDCGHCQKEVPKLYSDVYTKYKNKGVEVCAINATHGKVESWKKFIKEHKLTWLNLHDTGPYYDWDKTYDIYSFPVIYLLDENKIIKAKRVAVEQLGEIIDSLEKEKEQK